MQIAEVITGSQNHPIETPLEVQMASPNGFKHSAQAEDSRAQPLPATDHQSNDSAHEDSGMDGIGDAGSAAAVGTRIDPTVAATSLAQSTCPESQGMTKRSTVVPLSTVSGTVQWQEKAAGVVGAGGAHATAAPLFSFAGLPIKSVCFGSKASTDCRDNADVSAAVPHDTSVAESAPASATEVSWGCLLYTSPSPRDRQKSRMPSSA